MLGHRIEATNFSSLVVVLGYLYWFEITLFGWVCAEGQSLVTSLTTILPSGESCLLLVRQVF